MRLEIVEVRPHPMCRGIDRVSGPVYEGRSVAALGDQGARDIVYLIALDRPPLSPSISQERHRSIPCITDRLPDLLDLDRDLGTEVSHPGLISIDQVIGLLRPEVEEDDIARLEDRALADCGIVWIGSVDPIRRMAIGARRAPAFGEELDRKSTRLNSTHVAISYPV